MSRHHRSVLSRHDRSSFIAAVTERLQDRPVDWVEAHGFRTLVRSADETLLARKLQARRELVARDVLDRVVASRPGQVVLLKGLEVAQLYPTPLHRPSRDVDLMPLDAHALWTEVRRWGYEQNPERRADIDHHHLPALGDPTSTLGVEVHFRPNVPGWARLSANEVRLTARPSRTGVDGLLRPRDDIHALLLALHGWHGGFTKLRDLFDACLLALEAEVPVDRTAAELGLSRFWRLTEQMADAVLLDGRPPALLSRIVRPSEIGIARRRSVRLVAPALVAPPWRVAGSHLAAARLARAARHAA